MAQLGLIRRALRAKIVEILTESEYQVATYLPNYSDEALYQYVKGKTTTRACLFVSQPAIKTQPIDTVDSMLNVTYEIRIVMTTPQGVKLAQIPDEQPDTDEILDFIAEKLAENNPLDIDSEQSPRTAYISEFSELFTDETIDVAQCVIQFSPITIEL
jgi:hypothetical protein